ncbi:MAG: DnaT-like ssDNA-binding protein [Hyphomicrobiaceae bacterium]
MAVTFTVEDGTGLPTANSYASVAYADDYLVVKPDTSSWVALSSAEKERYLMLATRTLDQRATYRGQKAVEDSALRWPRVGALDCDSIAQPYDEVPDPIKQATVELAFHFVRNGIDPSMPISTSGEITKIKADVIEIEYSDGTQSSTVNFFPQGFNEALGCLGRVSTGRGSGFGRILRA